ncbi:MAG TPA: peptidylprolyl isomerase [Rhizomicrobium sp.]|nr:peptidylprolyl isomerase [Rhizomicrobium sp.]
MKPLQFVLIACAIAAGPLAGRGLAADAPAPAGGPPPEAFRSVDPDNLVLIDTKYGEVAVELSPAFAPNHVARLRKLIRAHFYDGRSFYRVIDGFVAQGGIGEDTASTRDEKRKDAALAKKWPPLKAEFDRPAGDDVIFTPLGNPDLFAPEVGHVDGFPVGRDPKEGRMWIVHCPGTFAFARDNADDTATTEFYIVIGEAPRRLDRNLTAFGRVLSGMQYLQKLERGDPDVESGVIQDPSKRDPIIRMRLASDIPAEQRPEFEVMRTDGADFAALKDRRRHPAPEFYHRPPLANLDICAVPVPVKMVPEARLEPLKSGK